MSRPRKKFIKRKPREEKHRINNQIRVPEIRLVGDNIEVGIYPTRKALQMAERMELDLVEIVPKAKPPVCKIIDYSKFLYEKKKKEKEIKAKTQKTVIKEIRFRPNTHDHDFEFKARHAERFLQEGAKVKACVQFKGRTIVFKERGELLLLKFAQRLEDFGTLDHLPKMEGRKMLVFFSPKKVVKPKPKKKPETQTPPKAKEEKKEGESQKETPKEDKN